MTKTLERSEQHRMEDNTFLQIRIDELKVENANLREVLKWYEAQLCEGFCKNFPTRDFYDPKMDIDCAGCRARQALGNDQ